MKDKKQAVDDLYHKIAKADKDNIIDLYALLEGLWDDAVVRAQFDHDMATLAFRLAKAIDHTGPAVVAERLGISVKELAKKVHPSALGEMTMSELRLLALSAEIHIEYDVFVSGEQDTEE